MFVLEGNFESDQNLFLTWVNKHRTREDYMKKVYEQSLFSVNEKEHLFEKILCDEDHLDATNLTLGQAKCFMKYFKLINKSRQHLMLEKKGVHVFNFKDLHGKEALWNYTIASLSQKARE